MKTKPYHSLALLAACAGIPFTTILAESLPAKSAGIPKGLTATDWSGIRGAYEAGRHAVFADNEGTLIARNPGQQWNTAFDGRGFTSTPDVGDWSWGFNLKSYGFGNAMKLVSDKATVSHEGGKVSYQWDGNLREWFINDTRGMEQGWTFQQRPEGALAGGSLHLNLAVRGGLVPRVSDDSASISFLNHDGGSALTYGGLKAWDADGKKLAVRFETAGEKAICITVDESAARYPITIDPVAQQAYLKASNPGVEDLFGSSVAVSGDTVVIGAPGEASNTTGVNGNQADNTAFRSGAAYVFVRSGGTWSQQAYLKASNTDSGDEFGISVAVSGDTVIVGAHYEDSNATGVNGDQANNSGNNCGAAYVFVRSDNAWSQQAYLKQSFHYASFSDNFGGAVALSGDTLVIGAHEERSNATGVNGDQADYSAASSGAAYVFVRSGATWSQQAYLKASNTEAGDGFGISVSMSGETVVVGASSEDSNATGVNGNQADNSASESGAAYVFVRSGSTWSQQAYLKASNTSIPLFEGLYAYFGNAVAVSGDTLVVGSNGESSNATGVNGNQSANTTLNAGAAYVFVRSGTTWSQQAYLKASNTGEGHQFGISVALSDNKAVVGANRESSNAIGVADDDMSFAGAAYVFVRSGATWSQQAHLKASTTEKYDRFGESVAVSGDNVVVGAPQEDSNATGVNGNQADNSIILSGAAYTFDLSVPNSPEIVVEKPAGTNLIDGATVTSLGSMLVGKTGTTASFTIRNTGSSSLTGLAIAKNGSHSSDFVVTGPGTSTVAPGAVTTFTVTFKPTAGGTRSAAIHIASNDADENPFDINLTGTAIVPVPEIVVEQPAGSGLVDGTAKKSFGTVKVGKTGTAKSFTIKNTGTANLTGLAITKDGKHSKEFTVSAPTKTSLAPGTSTTFKVTFKPKAKGSRKAAIHLKSNDANENPFDIQLTGLGTAQ